MKLILSISLGLLISGCAANNSAGNRHFEAAQSIVKIQAISASGKQNLGSGVVIAPDTVATNCHVMKTAQKAFLIAPERLYRVAALAASPEKDVCILKTLESLNMPAIELADSESARVGDDVVIAGYPLALSLRLSQGKIIALRAYKDDHIIEINTGFNHGASGGGVFDSSGKLVGLMTFMGKENGVLHFYVIPASWLESGLEEQEFKPVKPFSSLSFWENGDFPKAPKK